MLAVGCYLWSDPQWKHSGTFRYTPDHVRRLCRGVKANLTVPHEFICITDQPHAFDADPDIRAVPIDKHTHVPGTEFVKLMTFHPNGREIFGDVMLQLDLDTIVLGKIDHLVNRSNDIVVWRNPARLPYHKPVKAGRPYYNGSVILHRCGTLPELWRSFDASKPPAVRDTQVWMSNFLGPDAPYWDGHDGIFRLARDDTPGSGVSGTLPWNACIVTFVGSEHKPWLPAVRAANPWLLTLWPETLAA